VPRVATTKAEQCSMLIDEDIDEIIRKGEDKTAELQKKYADLDLDALNNFKSESMVNQWEGEDYTGKVCPFRLMCL
jgi:SWI/SNF-related matrix-associated actin-dependent regulator of chromatin subfamily A member 5